LPQVPWSFNGFVLFFTFWDIQPTLFQPLDPFSFWLFQENGAAMPPNSRRLLGDDVFVFHAFLRFGISVHRLKDAFRAASACISGQREAGWLASCSSAAVLNSDEVIQPFASTNSPPGTLTNRQDFGSRLVTISPVQVASAFMSARLIPFRVANDEACMRGNG
jgi:hypothetical protein